MVVLNSGDVGLLDSAGVTLFHECRIKVGSTYDSKSISYCMPP